MTDWNIIIFTLEHWKTKQKLLHTGIRKLFSVEKYQYMHSAIFKVLAYSWKTTTHTILMQWRWQNNLINIVIIIINYN